VAQARTGDQRALEALLRRHQDRLYAVCRRLTGSDSDAADALQDTLIAVVRGLPRFDGRSSFGTWSYRIAVNASLDELRARARRPEAAMDERSATVRDQAESVADRLDIDAALRRLTPEFRAPVVLRDVCQLDYAEIAEVLGLPPGTVRSRIARGRAALVGLLGERSESVGAA
jgi:RNA polymerase sigma-70 factor (ECF subfamily)